MISFPTLEWVEELKATYNESVEMQELIAQLLELQFSVKAVLVIGGTSP